MSEQATEAVAAEVAGLISRYGFELNGYSLDQWIDQWLRQYPRTWLRPAVVEALYQGRYKVISVTQILELWQRRGRPLHHFNREFERIICNEFPRMDLPILPSPLAPPPPAVAAVDRAADSSPEPESTPPSALPAAELPVLPASPRVPAATDSAILPFQPMMKRLEALEDARLRAAIAKQPIHQFIPAPEPSDFYSKLKSVVYSGAAVPPSERHVAPEDEPLPPGS